MATQAQSTTTTWRWCLWAHEGGRWLPWAPPAFSWRAWYRGVRRGAQHPLARAQCSTLRGLALDQ